MLLNVLKIKKLFKLTIKKNITLISPPIKNNGPKVKLNLNKLLGIKEQIYVNKIKIPPINNKKIIIPVNLSKNSFIIRTMEFITWIIIIILNKIGLTTKKEKKKKKKEIK